ncbi:hypothetical protein BCR44DRAFT_1291562 [Catenaria anguillulae PL171]|uniref:Uncharacterized protein n=1 Tax=Catenaria anguillulae PL171 TaxID=765915 RepID=A0A1Y2H7W2_9FUNG|nr:hypothetical protein BCR44DRAFT_1291562 [Catenaria anguillulae PL171]
MIRAPACSFVLPVHMAMPSESESSEVTSSSVPASSSSSGSLSPPLPATLSVGAAHAAAQGFSSGTRENSITMSKMSNADPVDADPDVQRHSLPIIMRYSLAIPRLPPIWSAMGFS